jgi:uncharacterized protein YcgI (DUF1989 family)
LPISGVSHILEPGTGKALELLRGQVLRIEQVAGGQCADFNAFNLHDYKEFFHAGRTRAIQGMFPTEGAVLWSAPPRERAMLTLIHDSAGINDLNFPRCTGALYEYAWGVAHHGSCQDVLAEAEGEYGLTPDDVHDSFNFWMNTGAGEDGRLFVKRNTAKATDRVELIAHMDVLAVVAVCSADLFNTSNFELKPLRLEVRESTQAERECWLLPERQLRNQRSVADFRVNEIKATRELRRDPGYRPVWPVHPIETEEVEVELSDEEAVLLDELRATGECGESDGEVLRHAFFSWCFEAEATPDAMRDLRP